MRHALLIATLLLPAIWLGNVSAQIVPQPADPPLWEGKPYGDGLYEYNDAVPATGANRLHAIGITGQGVSAAVLDTLFDINHPAIADNIIHEASANFTNGYPGWSPDAPNGGVTGVLNIGSQFVKVEPHHVNVNWNLGNFEGIPSHGTHVAGIVASMAPDAGLVLLNSSAEDADILRWYGYSLIFIQDFSDTDVLIDYAADIAGDYNIVALNGSYGTRTPFDNAEAADAQMPKDAAAINKLVNAGVIGLFASGNAAWNNYTGNPAAMSNASAIGSLSPYGFISTHSNQSEKVVLLAPGQNVYSAVPIVQEPYSTRNSDSTLEHGYASLLGTSMAAPHVTGAVSLLSSGARMASGEEIMQSLYDSADQVIYDGNAIVKKDFMPGEPNPVTVRDGWLLTMEQDADISKYTDWLTDLVEKYDNDEVTAEEWRSMRRINSAAFFTWYSRDDAASTFVSLMEAAGDFTPLQFTDYRFLRVDKVYMDLTAKRMNLMADSIAPGLSGMLRGYAGELYADIQQDTADIFQRLDAQDVTAQTIAARQMTPLFTNATAESAHLGFVRLHRSLGNREAMRSNALLSAAPPCGAQGNRQANRPAATTWFEGFGSGFDKNSTLTNAGYEGHFAGSAFGYERQVTKRHGRHQTLGLFGSWNQHRVSGDGLAKGDWITFGGYGCIEHRCRFIEGSLAYGYGEYGLTRRVMIPGATFSNVGDAPDIVLDPVYKIANASTHAHNFSMHVGTGRNLWKINGWTLVSRSEMSLSCLAFNGYREGGADSLNLVVDGYSTTYLEGGLGLFAGKRCRNLTATTKVMGMYGGMMGDNLSGSYVTHGSSYRVSTQHISSAWVLPDATLAWNVRRNVVLSGSYTGRFGGRYRENAGSVAVNWCW